MDKDGFGDVGERYLFGRGLESLSALACAITVFDIVLIRIVLLFKA